MTRAITGKSKQVERKKIKNEQKTILCAGTIHFNICKSDLETMAKILYKLGKFTHKLANHYPSTNNTL